MKNTFTILSLLLLSLILYGCSSEKDERTEDLAVVGFEPGDECHLCGMAITSFPGPKGELYEGRQNQVRKFCSTRDLMSWYLQPENKPNSKSLYVHDMTNINWNTPDDTHMTPAESAWFVAGSQKKGAMGPTLASFAKKVDAEAFKQQFGGRLLKFSEITMQVVNENPAHHH